MRGRGRGAPRAVLPLLSAAAAAPPAAGGAAAGADPALVRTTTGAAVGVAHPSLPWRMWRGLPYAEPPTGPLRWMPPVPKKPWEGVRAAVDYRAGCPQDITDYENIDEAHPSGFFASTTNTWDAEDCLYLNVFAPTPSSSSNSTVPAAGLLPVMVYIFGGGYNSGSAFDRELDPRQQVAGLGSVIFVTFNYRVGALGFAASAALRRRTPDGSVGNFATQDQRCMLRWLRANAAAFGGDPERVLLLGHDGHPAKHLVTPASWGLFRGVAFLSGAFQTWMARPMEHAEQQWAALLRVLGCPNGTEAGVACALNASAERVVQASSSAELPWQSTWYSAMWAPTVDGVELTDYPIAALRAGRVAPGAAVVLGTNRDEGTMFATRGSSALPYDVDQPGFVAWAEKHFGHANTAQLLTRYAAPKVYPSWYWGAVAAVTDFYEVCQSRRVARAAAAAGAAVRVYDFNHRPARHTADLSARRGSCHSCEIDFVFRTPWVTGAEEGALSAEMGSYLAAAIEGEGGGVARRRGGAVPPGGPPRDEWPQWDPAAQRYLRFDVASAGGTIAQTTGGLRAAECDWWDTLPEPAADCVLHPPYRCVNGTAPPPLAPVAAA